MPLAGLRYRKSSKKKTDKKGQIKVLNKVKWQSILSLRKLSLGVLCQVQRTEGGDLQTPDRDPSETQGSTLQRLQPWRCRDGRGRCCSGKVLKRQESSYCAQLREQKEEARHLSQALGSCLLAFDKVLPLGKEAALGCR